MPVHLGVADPLLLQRLLLLPPGGLLVLQPGHPVADLLQHVRAVVRLEVELVLEVLGRDEHLGVLLQQLGEVLEQAVLRPQEVELEVPLFPVHQVGEELPAVPGHELRRQLDHVEVEGRDGGGVGEELVLGRRLLQHDLGGVVLGDGLQQLGLLDGGQVLGGRLQLGLLQLRLALPEAGLVGWSSLQCYI